MGAKPGYFRQVPGPESSKLNELRDKYVAKAVANSTPIFVDKATGALITDVDGNEYIDFASGIGVLNVGSCPESVVAAVQEQAGKFLHTSRVFGHRPYLALAEKVCCFAPGPSPKKVFFINSGAEAMENAVRVARTYTGKQGLVVLQNSFHGRTLLTVSMSYSYQPYKIKLGSLAPHIYRAAAPYCYRCPYKQSYPGCDLSCAKDMERLIDREAGAENIAAIVVEPIQGEGGFIVCPPEYMHRIREICDKREILLILDEIQSGWGRSGKMFAIEYSGVEPDIIAAAKSLGGGIPLSVVISKAEIIDSFPSGAAGGTYAGNPLACAAAVEVMKLLERDNLVQRSFELGKIFEQRLKLLQEKYPVIGDVRGRGAMYAIEFVHDPQSKEPAPEYITPFIDRCQELGLVLIKSGVYHNVIRFLPPLVIEEELFRQAFDIMDQVLGDLTAR